MDFIKINRNSPSSSSVVSTINIRGTDAGDNTYWIGELPKPQELKEVTSIKFVAKWIEKTDYHPENEPNTTYFASAGLLTCPISYTPGMTYTDAMAAGGFEDELARFNTYNDEVIPWDSTIIVDMQKNPSIVEKLDFLEVSSKAAMEKFSRTKTFAINGWGYIATGEIGRISIYYGYADAVPFPTSMSPSVGVIDEKIANTFSWDIGFNGFVGDTLTQAKAKFEWKLKGEADEKIRVVDIDGAVKHYTLPANTLKDEDVILWRVTLTTNAGITGSPSPWIEIGTHESEPPKCKTITPNEIYVDGKSDVTFKWEHISPIGSKPTGYDIQIKKENQWTTIKTEMKTDKTTCRIPGTEFKAGTNYWRARTYNSDDVVGYWSDATAFYVVAKPNPPVLYPVESGKPRPLVRWTSEGQTGYQVQVLKNNEVIYDSEMTAGTATSYKITEYLDDGTYLFRVRIQNTFNKISDWGEYNHTISTQKPEKPTFGGTVIEDVGILLSLSYILKPGETAKVVRNGKIIGNIVTSFTDYSALGKCIYTIIVIDKNDCFNRSDEITLYYHIKDTQLSLVSNMRQSIHLNQLQNIDQPIRSGSLTFDATQNYFSGRKYAAIDYSEHTDENCTLSFIYSNFDDFEKLCQFSERKETLLYRDKFNKQFYCIISDITYQKMNYHTKFTLTLKRVDYNA